MPSVHCDVLGRDGEITVLIQVQMFWILFIHSSVGRWWKFLIEQEAKWAALQVSGGSLAPGFTEAAADF